MLLAWRKRVVKLLPVLCVCVLFSASAAFFVTDGVFISWRFVTGSFWVFLGLLIGLSLLVVNILFFAWQIFLAMQYKPYRLQSDEELPRCAVLIPAFNEGETVVLTLKSALASDYPPEKLEIIAINDGSRDDTWQWMKDCADASDGRIKAINMPRNGGKRKALYNGIMASQAEIFVTLDSDSEIRPDTLRQMVAPFANDPKVGGVAGNVRVRNTQSGLIPRMLDVSFVFSFDFLRSAQSMVNAVLCTPGALSAYRRDAVMPHIKEWIHERFLGKPANIGEDRAITNILLREGYSVVFQKTAVVLTDMPLTYGGLSRMMIRWGRSNVRENLAMSRFAFKRANLDDLDLTGMQINLIVQMFWMIAPLVFSFYALFCFATDSVSFLFGASFAILFWSSLPAFVYARHNVGMRAESMWSYVYGLFSFFTLFWVSPYCVFTVHKSGWLTRGETAESAISASPDAQSSDVLPSGGLLAPARIAVAHEYQTGDRLA